MVSKGKSAWYHDERRDEWILFFQTETKLICSLKNASRFTFDLKQSEYPSKYDPQMICYPDGDVCVYTPNDGSIFGSEVFGLDSSGEIIAFDPLFGRASSDRIATYGLYIRTAENLPEDLHESLSRGIGMLEAALNQL